MSQITIQCRLVASASTRQKLWKLMAELNTPLISELLMQMRQHPDFETWRQKGKISAIVIKQLCEPLKTDPRFTGQPARFYTSAVTTVSYIYKSWLALMKRSQYQLEGKIRWYEMLNSDVELVEASGVSLDSLHTKAAEILAQLAPVETAETQPVQGKKVKKGKKSLYSDSERNLSKNLFEAYGNTEDNLTRCAISYLLKNGCKISDKEENPEKFTKRRRKLEIQIQRLTEQLEARVPKGRDLTDSKWLETLSIASTNVPQNEAEAKSWQDALLRKSSSTPFPVIYESNEDMTWFKNQKGRICVKFNGISEHTFEVYCDSRHLHWFQRFLSDQEIKKNSKNQHSSSLFTLRSGCMGWQEGKDIRGSAVVAASWNLHHLTLYCTVDPRLWTDEGTKLVIEEKAEDIAKNITKAKEKGELNDKQLAHIKRKNSTLARINNRFPRPSKPLYKGQSHILMGVSLGLEKPATVAVVDVISGKILTYRSIKQLLGDNYKLLNRQRQQKQALSHARQIAQTQAAPNQYGDSELGQYIDRLLAKEIIAIAQKYSAGSIVLPKLDGMREQINSEIQLIAEEKCPESIEAQKKYAKQYRRSVNQWSYSRLIENIKSQAAKAGIALEESKQPIRGSPQDKAKELVFAAYKSRKKS
jgi:IS605 OrfB family transposase